MMNKIVGNRVSRDKFKFGFYRFTDVSPTLYGIYWGYGGYVWQFKKSYK